MEEEQSGDTIQVKIEKPDELVTNLEEIPKISDANVDIKSEENPDQRVEGETNRADEEGEGDGEKETAKGDDDEGTKVEGGEDGDGNEGGGGEGGEGDVDDEEEDEDEDEVKVTIEDTVPDYNLRAKQRPAQQAKPTAIDLEAGQAILDVDLSTLEDKPWRKPGADISDYFNYGFDENTWKLYCDKQKKMKNVVSELTNSETFKIPVVNPGNDHSKYGGVMKIPTIVSNEPRFQAWIPPTTLAEPDEDRERERERDRHREREREKTREREKDRDRDKEREKEKIREREKDREREKERDRDRDKDRDRDREKASRSSGRDREKNRDRDRHRDAGKKRERSRDRERDKKRKRSR